MIQVTNTVVLDEREVTERSENLRSNMLEATEMKTSRSGAA